MRNPSACVEKQVVRYDRKRREKGRVSGCNQVLVYEIIEYASSAPRMVFTVKRGVYGHWTYRHPQETSHPEWGEPKTAHYAIVLGERVELVD